MSVTIAVRDIDQSQLLWTPKYREKSVSFNVERYIRAGKTAHAG
jgi:hypothetical protein